MIEPKYKIGQTCFFLKDNVMKEERVTGINGFYSKHKNEYGFEFFGYNFNEREAGYGVYQWVDEDKIFATKEELLASL